MNKRKDIVPNNLKEYRLKAGYTQKEAAQFLGFISEDRICHWEKGRNVPSLMNLLKLSSLYRATPMQMYSELMINADAEVENLVTKKTFRKEIV